MACAKTGPQDVGGDDFPAPHEDYCATLQQLASSPPAHHQWEKEVRCLFTLLFEPTGTTWDVMRRHIEALPEDVYRESSYYERWALALVRWLIEEGKLKREDLLDRLGYEEGGGEEVRFSPGDAVKVKKQWRHRTPWERPHLRTPGYLFGAHGEVERVCGAFPSPSLASLGVSSRPSPLYRVRFLQADIWEGYEGLPSDTVDVEIYQSWLEPATGVREEAAQEANTHPPAGALHKGSHPYEKYSEGERPKFLRVVEALKDVAVETGLTSLDALRKAVEAADPDAPCSAGARLVVKAWLDPAFKALLLADPGSALAQEGLPMAAGSTTDEHHHGPLLVVVKNTPAVHNVVVCTLCSCYPTALLGSPPAWYKSLAYRASVVRRPRSVLAEQFGTSLPPDVTIRVHDSTADMRYLVLPCPPDSLSTMSHDELLAYASRDRLVGVAR